jgi:hypothetical protein
MTKLSMRRKCGTKTVDMFQCPNFAPEQHQEFCTSKG